MYIINMSRTETDYSNTLIYKIYCKDPAINDIYVGHTTNFVQRKFSHKQGAQHSSNKLYDTIRNNGGWANWKMEIVAFFDCQDLREARQKEQEFFLSCKATLNSIEPFPTTKEVVIKKPQVKKEKNVIVDENVDKNVNENVDENVDETKKKLVCDKCDYKCNKNSEFRKHLLTRKHQTNENIKDDEEHKHVLHICKCGKRYTFRQGLSVHKKICTIENSISQESIVVSEENDKHIIKTLLKEMSEFKNIILDMVESNNDFKQQILDMSKNNNV